MESYNIHTCNVDVSLIGNAIFRASPHRGTGLELSPDSRLKCRNNLLDSVMSHHSCCLLVVMLVAFDDYACSSNS